MGIAHKDVSVKQSIALTYIKFIPILFAIFGGIFYFALKGSAQNPVLNSSAANSNAPFNLIKFSPIFGVMSAIPAIFFAFDGFYSVGGVYADMKEPKKFSSALSIGIAITSAIYLLISIGLLLGAKGGAING
jgi:amino acid transporter